MSVKCCLTPLSLFPKTLSAIQEAVVIRPEIAVTHLRTADCAEQLFPEDLQHYESQRVSGTGLTVENVRSAHARASSIVTTIGCPTMAGYQ